MLISYELDYLIIYKNGHNYSQIIFFLTKKDKIICMNVRKKIVKNFSKIIW